MAMADIAGLPSIDQTRNWSVTDRKNGNGGQNAVEQAESSSNSVAPEDIAVLSTSTSDPRASTASSSAPIDYESLISEGGKAKPIPAVSCLDVLEDDLEQLIIQLVETQGEPMVITDLHKTSAWNSDLFDPHKVFASVPKEELYGTDRSCHPEWSEALAKVVHRRLVYQGQHDVFSRISRGLRRTEISRFDLGTARTPLKRGLCSSLVQNLMIWSDPEASAVWFITNPEDNDAVDEYLTKKGGSPHYEGHIPPANELAEATFSLSFWRQRVGDLVLVPPRAAYMVMNSGGRSVKTAWSRLIVDSLVSALFTDLPLYQRRCQRESHHIKSVIEHTVVKYTQQVTDNIQGKLETPKARIRDLSTLLQSYDALLSDEYAPDWRDIPVEGDDVSYVECDVCGADTMHGFFECKKGDTLCVQCYCQGRLCPCSDATDSLRPYQLYRNFGERLQIRNQAAQALLSVDPTLALTVEQRVHSGADDDDDEPPLLQVELLKEEDVGKRSWPLSFLAATNLYKLRQTTGWRDDLAPCRICKATLDSSQRYFCKPCGHSYCFGCLLHKLYIHPAHVLAQNEPKLFHSYHKKASTLDYKEWKQDPFEFRDEARAHFALIEAARTNMNCVPQTPGCQIGFLDVSDEHKHGLSGTLGVTRPCKTQTDKVKAAAASSSPASTPVPRKRTKNSSEAPSAASPKSPSRKKVRIEAPRLLEAMDEDDGSGQMSRAEEAINVPRMASAPVPSPLTATQGVALGATNGTQMSSTQAVTSFPTVANGIRKFVLREGKAHPVSPVIASQSLSTPPSSSPAMSPLIAAKVVPSQPSASASAPRNGSTSLDPTNGSLGLKSGITGVIEEGDGSAAANMAAALAANNAYRAELAARARAESAAVPTKLVGGAERPTSAESEPGTAQTATASAAVRIAPPSSLSPKTPSPPAAIQAQAADQNTLALATSVVAAGITSGQTAPAAASPPTAGLGSLDPMTLRVVTEVLRIYSQANEKKLEEHVAQLTKTQIKHAAEQARAQQTNAQMQATLLQRIDQLSSEVKTLTKVHAAEVKSMQDKHELEVRKLRLRMDEVARQQTASDVRVDKLDDKFQGLFDDIDRQAQAALQAELSTQSSQAASSGQVMSGDHFVPLSNAR
uniref:JmjC domain-containing protein n=2 Tax=Kalmanozyma brasiliensis (strain GHG001) TaxID=1365824 RepID=V5E5X5_KALBG